MTNKHTLRSSFLIALALAASGCGLFKKGKGPSTPVLGQRIAVLTGEGDVAVDPDQSGDLPRLVAQRHLVGEEPSLLPTRVGHRSLAVGAGYAGPQQLLLLIIEPSCDISRELVDIAFADELLVRRSPDLAPGAATTGLKARVLR